MSDNKTLKRALKATCAAGMSIIAGFTGYHGAHLVALYFRGGLPGEAFLLIPAFLGTAACTGAGATILGKQALLGNDNASNEEANDE